MTGPYLYERDGAAIYRQSFAMIRAEADLARFAPEEVWVAVRIIHGCGMVEVASDIAFAPGAVTPREKPSRREHRCFAMLTWWRRASPGRACHRTTR